MIKQYLILAILPASLAANAICMTDQPEIGDIGPSSELVCEALALRFPDSVIKLRKAFGDQAREPSIIETIPKRGYRLVAPVRYLGRRRRSSLGGA